MMRSRTVVQEVNASNLTTTEQIAKLEYENRELRRFQDLFYSAQGAAGLGMWEIDLESNRLYWSDRVYEIHEVPPSTEVLLEEGIDFYHPDFQPVIKKAVQEAIDTGKSWNLEMLLVTAKRREVWVRAIGWAIREDDKTIKLGGLFQEIDESKRLQRSLEDQIELMSLAIDAGSIGIWEWDVNDSTLKWNDDMHRHFDWPKSKFKGTYNDFSDRLSKKDLGKVEAALQESVNTGISYDIEYEVICQDSSTKSIMAKGNVVKDYKGDVQKMIGVCIDLSENKEIRNSLEQSEEKFRSIMEDSAIGMALVSKKGKFTDVNRSLAKMLGYSKEEILSTDFQQITHPDDLQADLDLVNAVLRNEIDTYEIEKRYYHKKGHLVWAQLNVSAVHSKKGKVQYFISQIQDITLRKEAEKEQESINEKLEIEVAKRTSELKSTNKELEAFSYSVSHDLRSPLRSIQGFSEALVEDYSDKLDETGKNYLQRVSAATLRMSDLIDQLLSLSRISRKKAKVKIIDMTAMAKSIVKELRPADHYHIKIAKDLVVYGDTKLIRIVMTNLIGNAIKYSSKTDHPKIEITRSIEKGFQWIHVKDNGAGFDMEYAEKLFGAFQRLHSTDEFVGTGIGLATVQRIINIHGGKIKAYGELDKGAQFSFTLKKRSN